MYTGKTLVCLEHPRSKSSAPKYKANTREVKMRSKGKVVSSAPIPTVSGDLDKNTKTRQTHRPPPTLTPSKGTSGTSTPISIIGGLRIHPIRPWYTTGFSLAGISGEQGPREGSTEKPDRNCPCP